MFFIMGFLTVVAVNWREKSTMAKSVPQDLKQITPYIHTFYVTIEFCCFHESENYARISELLGPVEAGMV